MDAVRLAALVLATISTGMVAGIFYGFSISVLVTMRGVDDRTYVDLNQKINRDIQNGRFYLVFVGAVPLHVLAIVLMLGGGRGSVLLPAIIGLVVYFAAFVVTVAGNLPLVAQLDKAGARSDATAVRRRYEAPWVRFHTIRTILHTGAFGAFCWALIAFGAL